MDNNLSRREFLRKAGKGILGAAAVAALPVAGHAETAIEAPVWPWKWEELDPQEALEAGYKAFYTHGGCCAGAVSAIVEVLAGKYGYPYNQINARMFADGAGGYGVQSLCGSLGGACAVFGMFLEGGEAGAMRNELYAWYKGHAFPQYQPEIESITTVADSVECRDSVGKYMAATGYTMADAGRKARCAAVTGEVAAKAADLLNLHFGYYTEPKVVDAPAEEVALADNEYIGEGVSAIGGPVKVKVTMDGEKIAKIEVLEHNETPGISDPAFNTIPQAILDKQSTTGIDAVTGATKTSDALIAAVNDALSKVGK